MAYEEIELLVSQEPRLTTENLKSYRYLAEKQNMNVVVAAALLSLPEAALPIRGEQQCRLRCSFEMLGWSAEKCLARAHLPALP